MTTIAILGAYGRTGSVVTEELSRRCNAQLRVGGRDLAAANELSERVGGSIAAGRVDVADDRSLDDFIAGSDIVVNCAGPSALFEDRVARAAVERGCAYVDPGGDVSSFASKDGWDELAGQGRPAIIHAGWIPGLTGVLTAFAVDLAREEVATIDSVELVYGDRSVWSRTGLTDILATAWGPNSLGVYERGKWRLPRRLGLRRVRLPSPFGSEVAIASYLAELRSLGEAERGAVVACYLAPLLSARKAAAYIRASMLFPFAPARAAESLEKAYARAAKREEPGGILAVKVTGSAEDGRHEVRASVIENRNYWITGLACAVAAQMVADGGIKAAGLHYLAEVVDPAAFILELRRSGLEVRTTRRRRSQKPGLRPRPLPFDLGQQGGADGSSGVDLGGRNGRAGARQAAGIELSAFSGWIDPPQDLAPPLRGSETSEVAIVGGGYTGLAAALRLAEAGRDVALLESAFCGFGASSRNAGHLTPTIAGDPNVLLTLHRGRASQLLELGDSGVDFTESLIERLQIECDYERTGNVYASLTPAQLRRAKRLSERLAELGGNVGFIDEAERTAIGLPAGFLGGIHERRGGHLDPGKLCRGLRQAAREAGVRIYEETHVRDLGLSVGRPLLRSESGELRADQVLIATNAHARDLAIPTPTAVAPLWVTMAETEPIGDVFESLRWRSRAGLYTQHVILESYRPTARRTIVFGTRVVEPPRNGVGVRRPDENVVRELLGAFHERFPALSDVRAQRAWGGWIGMTSSWLPIVGEACPGMYYALGYNGHGLAQAPYLGTLVAERMLGYENEHLSLLWRSGGRFAPVVLATRPAVKAGWLIDRLTDRGIQRA
jgi:glycine/D-amino acid oxidase-like deaminating enzyme